MAAAASPRRVSAERPRGARGVAETRLPAERPRGTRSVAATRLHGLSTWHPRHRRRVSAERPGPRRAERPRAATQVEIDENETLAGDAALAKWAADVVKCFSSAAKTKGAADACDWTVPCADVLDKKGDLVGGGGGGGAALPVVALAVAGAAAAYYYMYMME